MVVWRAGLEWGGARRGEAVSGGYGAGRAGDWPGSVPMLVPEVGEHGQGKKCRIL